MAELRRSKRLVEDIYARLRPDSLSMSVCTFLSSIPAYNNNVRPLSLLSQILMRADHKAACRAHPQLQWHKMQIRRPKGP